MTTPITPLDATERELMGLWKKLVEHGDTPVVLLKNYSRLYTKYVVLRLAADLDRASNYSAARVLKDKAEQM
jgi:hypothetical protein